MNSWINLDALWKIVVIGLLAGAGLPALFALGLLALAPSDETAGSPTAAAPRPNMLGKLIAGLCFAAVLTAMGWGVYSIVHSS
ncbi:hypothetical protein GCM10009839_32930 [Catenulispora yoronensis]|uniref:Uncharacterized protein n=1 Tax=Catenulispora yoronensis TaxID=450799 RepID=A0ABN2U7N0_9ACTN